MQNYMIISGYETQFIQYCQMTTIINPLLVKIEFSGIWQCVDLTSTCKWPEQAPATQGNITLVSESKTISIIVF
jgi:hypothetical protein